MTERNTILFSEGWLYAALLDMVAEHCRAEDGVLKSFGWKANARAMQTLADADYLEISKRDGDAIEGRITQAGRDLLEEAARQEGCSL